MIDTEIIEARILTAARIVSGVLMVWLLWAAMCGWLS